MFFASEVLDDPLLGTAVFTHALDEVEVGVAVDLLLAEERLAISTRYYIDPSSNAHNYAISCSRVIAIGFSCE